MAVDQEDLHEILDQVFAHPDMVAACKEKDLAAVIWLLGKYGITQGQISRLTGFPQPQLSDYKHRKHIPTAKSTFEQFAGGLGMPTHLRRIMGLAALGSDEGAPDGASGGSIPAYLSDSLDVQLVAAEIGKRRGAVNRREMIELAAAAGSSAVLGRRDIWERLSYAISRPSAIDEIVVSEVEACAAGFHSLDQIYPAHSLFRGIAAHLKEVSTLLNGTADDPDDELRHRLLIVAGESSALAGWWASDFGDTSASMHLYKTAERAAKEADDFAIIACLLGYKSYMPSTKGNHGLSRRLLSDAMEVLPHRASPTASAWLAARHAEESAALGDGGEAMKSWRRAEEAFSIADPEDDRTWVRFFNKDRFDSCCIATFANVPGKLEKAEEIASSVLSRTPSSEHKRTVIILGDIATAHLRHGHINEACRIGKDGLAILRETRFSMWLPRYEAIARGVTRWRNRMPVKAYLEEFSTTKRQFPPV